MVALRRSRELSPAQVQHVWMALPLAVRRHVVSIDVDTIADVRVTFDAPLAEVYAGQRVEIATALYRVDERGPDWLAVDEVW